MIVQGRLAGDVVPELAQTWAPALAEALPRRLTLDISYMDNYDAAARRLLREMHGHGTEFAAATPLSLVFLAEITAEKRRGGPIALESLAPKRRAAAADFRLPAASSR
jgi:hypothetical protein